MAALITSRFAALGVLFGLALGLHGQVISPVLDSRKSQPPESGIYDRNGFFRSSPELKNRISEQLIQLRELHEYHIYLVLEPVMIGSTVQDLAEKLRSEWLPDGDGLVVVFEANSRGIGYGWDLCSIDFEDAPLRDNEIPTHEISGIIQRSVSGLSVNVEAEAYIDALMQNIVRECSHYFQQRAMPLPEGRNRLMLLLVVVVTCILIAISFLLGIILRRFGRIGQLKYRFAETDATERFGAPAGTSAVSRSFKDD